MSRYIQKIGYVHKNFRKGRESKKNLKICGRCVKMRNSLIQFFEGSFGGFEGIKL